ncbi:MAG TPA: urea transporter [Geothrix sp.]
MAPLLRFGRSLLQGYATILFSEGPLPGFLVLAATFWSPHVGIAGLAMALMTLLLPRWLALPMPHSPVTVCNGILVGLFVAGLRGPGWALVPWLLIAAGLTVVARTLLGEALWRWNHLPLLSLPFVLVTWFLLSAFTPIHAPPPSPLYESTATGMPLLATGFLRCLGAVICTPHPAAGLLLLFAMLVSSRILALLALGGYLAGMACSALWAKAGLGWLPPTTEFNYPLVAMALGGFFLVPSLRSLLTAGLGVLAVALLIASGSAFLAPYQLPILAFPFVGATLVLLATLRSRTIQREPHLVLERPRLPEVNLERLRLARCRGLELVGVPLVAPFFGEWQVYQGFDGPHTHREAWRHALDFFLQEGGRSFQGEGRSLEAYFCFGLPVLSPCLGTVAACRDDLPDMPPGEVDARHNWGNYVMIKLASGLYVLLAHLKQGSLRVGPGDLLQPGTLLAACGSSGRSPQPHLHLQVQADEHLGSPTVDFHLVDLLVREPGSPRPEFRLHGRPLEGSGVASAQQGAGLGQAFHLPVQRCLRYRVRSSRYPNGIERRLTVELGLDSEFRIRSDRGASAAFQSTGSVFACYDRDKVPDDFLDVWLLSLGFSPFSLKATAWRDRASAHLLPLAPWARLLADLSGAALAGLHTVYRRREGATGGYLQSGRHHHPMGWLFPALVTRARISPDHGALRVQARLGRQRWNLELLSIGPEFVDHQANPSKSGKAGPMEPSFTKWR